VLTGPNGGPYALEFDPVNGPSRRVASLNTSMPPNVAACSPGSKRAVIVTASGAKNSATSLRLITFGELDVIELQSGKVAFRQSFPVGTGATEVRSVAVSHDGTLAAEATQTGTVIVSLATGKEIVPIPGVTPLAFSWDGSFLAVTGPSNRGELVRVQSGSVVWTDSQAGRVTQWAVARPDSPEVMMAVDDGGLTDLLSVSGDGSVRTIAVRVLLHDFSPCTACSAA
jgi:WD40 repeat protein